MKKVILLLFFILISSLLSPKSALAVACSPGDLPNINYIVPPNMDRAEDIVVSIISAPAQFRGQTLYFEIYRLTDAEPPFNRTTEVFPQPIQLDANGNGQATINIGEINPTLANGFYRFDITGEQFGTSCINTPSFQIEVFGDSGCLPLQPGDSCNPAGTTPICLDYECLNGTVILPQLSTFSYICQSPNPPTCRECENFPDGTRVCGDLNPARPVNCQAICAQEETSATAFAVSRGCDQGEGHVNTAIGCIPFNIISNTTKFFLAWGLGIGGGVALLLIGISGLMFATSSGIPAKVESAKSLFWAALTGLGMLLLSVFLLRFIGVDVLELFQ